MRQSHRNDALKNAEIEKRITTEITYRIKQALSGVKRDQINIKKGRAYAPDAYYANVVRYLDNSFLIDKSDPQDFSFYPEYRDLKFEPLVANLMVYETSTRQTLLKQAVKAYKGLVTGSEMGEEGWLTTGTPPNEIPTTAAVQQSKDALAEASKTLESNLLPIFLQWSGFIEE